MRRALAALVVALAVAALVVALGTCDGPASVEPGAGPARVGTTAPETATPAAPRARVRAGAPAAPADAGDAAAPAPPAAAEPAILRIVDESGTPVPGMLVWWRDDAPDAMDAADDFTGEDGEVGRGDAASAVYFDGTGLRVVPLTGAVTESVARGLPALEIDVVDGLTGAPSDVDDVRVRTIWRDDDGGFDAPLRRAGSRWVLPAIPLVRGTGVRVQVGVVARDGRIAEPPFRIDTTVAPGTHAVRVTAATYPEADVQVTATLPDGAAPRALEVSDVEVRRGVGLWAAGVRELTARAEPGAVPGTWRVRGLPSVPHLRMRLGVRAPRGEEDPFGVRPHATTRWLALDAPATATVALDVLDDMNDTDVDSRRSTAIGIGGGGGDGPLTDENSSPVTVRVLRHDGSPAAGAWVGGGDDPDQRTDGEGRVVVRLRHGRRRVTGFLFPMLPTSDLVTVPADGEFVLREPRGRALEVVVVDEADRPAPLASVDLRAVSWTANDGETIVKPRSVGIVEQGVQWPELRTDALGRLRLARVPAGTIRVVATLGSAIGSAQSDAPEVRVVIRQPE